MRQWGWWALVALAVGLSTGARPAAAQTIIGNFPPTNDSSSSADLDTLRYKALGFTIGATAYTLTGVRLRLDTKNENTGIVELRNDSGGVDPGASVVVGFNNPSPGEGVGTYTFTPTSAFTLQANTKYWLVVRGTTDTGWDWRGSSPGVTPTGPGATFGGNRFSTNGGSSWSSSSIVNSFEILGTIGDASAVPEPSAALLFLPALAVVGLIRRHRGKGRD